MNKKLQSFAGHPVQFIATSQVVEGVNCDVYHYVDKESECDLGIVTVAPNKMTPRQKVCDGSKTIERYISGPGVLLVTRENGIKEVFSFPDKEISKEIAVKIGDEMQWQATGDSELVIAEICYPPYKEGRFKNL